jgi:FAD/FMN-containing dehydrogenase
MLACPGDTTYRVEVARPAPQGHRRQAMHTTLEAYESKKSRLLADMAAAREGAVRLGKDTSNLFRDRTAPAGPRLDVRAFNQVLEVDPGAGVVDVEGMTTYGDLTAACLARGVMPAVVPQLKTITIGGAVAGVGIESSSFRYGLVHETVRELEVLLADGRSVVCTPANEHADLFYGLPNSYGTLGYVLRLKALVVPIKPFVHLTHVRYTDARALFEALGRWCDEPIDFLDGTVFGRDEYYLTIGRLVEQAPYASDYTYERIYYRSIREREEDYLTVADYIWRWDTDWFWCSKNLLAQNPLVRRLYGRTRLNSLTYTKMMRWNARWQVTQRVGRLLGLRSESVIQDVDIPLERGPEFLDFYLDTIRFTPVWLCPIRPWREDARFPLYPLEPRTVYVNFGFWDVIRHRGEYPEGHFNRLLEARVRELGGIKSLYSDAYYSEAQFWETYDRRAYAALKARYDPAGRFKDLYAKCVLRE